MNKLLSFFRTASPLLLISVSIGLGIVAKLIESKFADIALSLQLITFGLFIYALIKFFNSRFKK